MTMRSLWLSLTLLVGYSSLAGAQAVQLPSVSVFGVDTTVSAPDGGSVLVGGVGRSSTGSTAFGPGFGPRRGIGRSTSASQLRVKATVHDFAAQDEALLNEARKKGRAKGKSGTPGARASRRLALAGESSAGRAPSGSLAEARRKHAAELSDHEEEVRGQVEKARKAAAAGKPKVAKIFYKMALRDASDEWKRKINREMKALDSQGDLFKVASAPDIAVSPDIERAPERAAKRTRAEKPKAGEPRGF